MEMVIENYFSISRPFYDRNTHPFLVIEGFIEICYSVLTQLIDFKLIPHCSRCRRFLWWRDEIGIQFIVPQWIITHSKSNTWNALWTKDTCMKGYIIASAPINQSGLCISLINGWSYNSNFRYWLNFPSSMVFCSTRFINLNCSCFTSATLGHGQFQLNTKLILNWYILMQSVVGCELWLLRQ